MSQKKNTENILQPPFFHFEHRRPLLFRLTNRMTLFLTLLLSSLILFYITGNYQQFLDADQHLILLLCTYTAAALALFSFFSFIEAVVFLIVLKNNARLIFILHAVVLFFLFAAAVFFAFVTRSITFFAAGL